VTYIALHEKQLSVRFCKNVDFWPVFANILAAFSSKNRVTVSRESRCQISDNDGSELIILIAAVKMQKNDVISHNLDRGKLAFDNLPLFAYYCFQI